MNPLRHRNDRRERERARESNRENSDTGRRGEMPGETARDGEVRWGRGEGRMERRKKEPLAAAHVVVNSIHLACHLLSIVTFTPPFTSTLLASTSQSRRNPATTRSLTCARARTPYLRTYLRIYRGTYKGIRQMTEKKKKKQTSRVDCVSHLIDSACLSSGQRATERA